jgi:methyltransferase (TIGR00027 family)
MIEGTASRTARSVAAHRLDYPRLEAPYGAPAADEALARDVAAGLEPAHGRMHDYLRKRTAFFDRVVVETIDRGDCQVVVGGAGYDGRSLRYARPGTTWFELDHPDTQADKRERLGRLGIDAGHVRFVPADFTTDPVADLLTAAGLDPRRPALFLLEGVVIYLTSEVLERLLGEFRSVTPARSMLATSVLAWPHGQARARFREAVAAVGEPPRSDLSADEVHDLLARTGWQVTDPGDPGPDRRAPAGLLVARAIPLRTEQTDPAT